MYFKNRVEAGKRLAKLLTNFSGENTVIYALPRGGVVTGAEVAKVIHAPLDLIITRKIGHPLSPEYAIGAVAENGHSVFNKEGILGIDERYLTSEAEKQKGEARRRREVYLNGKKSIFCKGKTAILVDDGIATGLTIKAAIKELKMHFKPKKIIVAVPTVPQEIANELEDEGVKVLALISDKDFLSSIGAYYQDFSPVSDGAVINIMKKYRQEKLIEKEVALMGPLASTKS